MNCFFKYNIYLILTENLILKQMPVTAIKGEIGIGELHTEK